MKIIKRSGAEAVFDPEKIRSAISRANLSVDKELRLADAAVDSITDEVVSKCEGLGHAPAVEEIQDLVEHSIMKAGAFDVAKNYITYRYDHQLARNNSRLDDRILSLVSLENEEAKQENSNKNPVINSTQRDYMASEVSEDLTWRKLLPPDIVQAHKEGIIHFHK